MNFRNKIVDLFKQGQGTEDLPDSAFALIETASGRRFFPINTPSNAVASAESFKGAMSNMSLIEKTVAATNVARALVRFSMPVPDEIAKYIDESIGNVNTVEGTKETAGPVQFYLLEEGGIRLFPVSSPEDVMRYVAAYTEIIKELSPEELKKFRSNLAEAIKFYKLESEIHPALIKELSPSLVKEKLQKMAQKRHLMGLKDRVKLESALDETSKIDLRKLGRAVAMRKAMLQSNPLYADKLAEVDELLQCGDIAGALELLDAIDAHTGGRTLFDELLADEAVASNPLREALVRNLPQLMNVMDTETLATLLDSPEEVMQSNPVVQKIVYRIIKLK